eukprot:329605-Rhodomonas_salina.1
MLEHSYSAPPFQPAPVHIPVVPQVFSGLACTAAQLSYPDVPSMLLGVATGEFDERRAIPQCVQRMHHQHAALSQHVPAIDAAMTPFLTSLRAIGHSSELPATSSTPSDSRREIFDRHVLQNRRDTVDPFVNRAVEIAQHVHRQTDAAEAWKVQFGARPELRA